MQHTALRLIPSTATTTNCLRVGQIGFRRFRHEVKVIAYQAVGMQQELKAGDDAIEYPNVSCRSSSPKKMSCRALPGQ